ncbi:hypothetical protein [Agaribacterium haliotis]|uniref:hypothetical protein n=1 Tax=Agaribacterium haliotis TaxID=2013869 RepID=UPI000BB578FD|nr:hypothetical protein [Agaribacterium haliotis]
MFIRKRLWPLIIIAVISVGLAAWAVLLGDSQKLELTADPVLKEPSPRVPASMQNRVSSTSVPSRGNAAGENPGANAELHALTEESYEHFVDELLALEQKFFDSLSKEQLDELFNWGGPAALAGSHRHIVYRNYDNETLTLLSDSNDYIASHLLVDRYLQSLAPEHLDNAESLAIRMAVNSDISSLKKLADINRKKYNNLQSFGEHDKAKRFRVESLAWELVFLTRSGEELGPEFELLMQNEGDYTQISERADQLYQVLEGERQTAGLGAFNNLRPDYIDLYMDQLERLENNIVVSEFIDIGTD